MNDGHLATHAEGDETLESCIAAAERHGLVPCVPKRFSAHSPYGIVFVPPESIPKTSRQLIIKEPHRTSRAVA